MVHLWNLFKLEQIDIFNDEALADVRNLYKNEEENYYEPIIINDIFCDRYIGYENNDYRYKKLSLAYYLLENEPNLKDLIKIFQKS